MAEHCIAPPSSRNRTVQCPGHVVMERRALQARPYLEDSEASREGTAAHWVTEILVKYGELPPVGMQAPNGVVVDADMHLGATMLRDAILADLAPYGVEISAVAVEVAVTCPRIHPQVWGTPDYRVWIPGGPRPRLLLWDYKYGHEPVEVYGCYQLTDYASGCLSGINWNPETIVDVELVIVQPRAYHRNGLVRKWKTDTRELLHYFETSALATYEALYEETPPVLKVGPECKNCVARTTCPAQQRAGLDACDDAYRAQVHDLTPIERGVELRRMKRALLQLDARVKALMIDAEEGIRRGQQTPGWRLEPGMGSERWSVDPSVVIGVADEFGIDVRKRQAIITPKQAITAGLPRKMVEELSSNIPGAMQLVEDDGSKARALFGAK